MSFKESAAGPSPYSFLNSNHQITKKKLEMEFAKKCRDTRMQRDHFLIVTFQIGKEEKVPLIANPAFSHSRASVIAAGPIFFLIIIAVSNSTTTTFKSILTLFRISAQSAFAADLL